MGLFTGLITLPLAPVRGVVWLAEQIQGEAERQWADPAAVRQQLEDIDRAYRDGALSEEERDRRQDALVARLLAAEGARPGAERG